MLAAEVRSVKALRRMARRFFRGGDYVAQRVSISDLARYYLMLYAYPAIAYGKTRHAP